MKTLLMSLALVFTAAVSFAASTTTAQQGPLPMKPILSLSVLAEKPIEQTCTVSVTHGSVTNTVTASCDCTKYEACQAAFRLATLFMKKTR
ncbi:MAG: hypothetical protein KGP35_03785 [Bacteroidetes bacterium]|nr:hypothetical protein [Bacteroidota bacterium]